MTRTQADRTRHRPSSMRELSILSMCALLAAGCTNTAQGQPGARVVSGRVCVPAARTSGDAPQGAASGCRSITTTSAAWDEAWDAHLCGPCNFAYDHAATLRERAAGHPTDCCYEPLSPPPPPGGPRS